MTTKIFKIYLTELYLQDQFKKGNIKGSIHLSFGQEHIDAKEATGFVLGNHRSHGQYIARTDDIEGLIEQVCSGNSQHLYKPGEFLAHGIQGALSGVAVGLASEGVDVTYFIGDGTVGQGILWEALGMCEGLPVVFVVIDNDYSMSLTKKTWLHNEIKHHPNVKYYNTLRVCGHSVNDTQMYRPRGERDMTGHYDYLIKDNQELFEKTKIEVYGRINDVAKRNKFSITKVS